MLPDDREAVQRRQVSWLAPSWDIQLCADAPDKSRSSAFSGKHSTHKEQIAGLDCFDVNAERFGRGRQLHRSAGGPIALVSLVLCPTNNWTI